MCSFLTPCQSNGWKAFHLLQRTSQHVSLDCTAHFWHLLTLAGVPSGFVAGETLALAHRNHPFTLSCAVDAWGGMTDGVLHAGSLDLLEAVRHCLWEGRQALHCGRACLVVNSDREQRHTSAHVLKSQVEALPGQRPHDLRFGVDLQHTTPGDLIRSDGSHFAELPFAEVGSHISIGFWDEKVEGFFAGDGGSVKRVAVSDDKAELHGDTRCPWAPLDECCTEPVILFSRVYTTNTVGIEKWAIHHSLDYLPL